MAVCIVTVIVVVIKGLMANQSQISSVSVTDWNVRGAIEANDSLDSLIDLLMEKGACAGQRLPTARQCWTQTDTPVIIHAYKCMQVYLFLLIRLRSCLSIKMETADIRNPFQPGHEYSGAMAVVASRTHPPSAAVAHNRNQLWHKSKGSN